MAEFVTQILERRPENVHRARFDEREDGSNMVRAAATRVEHEITVRSAAEPVFRLLADIGNWPMMFRPFVHLEHLGDTGGGERIGMWTTFGDSVEHWVVERAVDDATLRIDFRPEVVDPPLESMERSWRVEPVSTDECVLRLVHHFRVMSDDSNAVLESIDSVANSELAAVKAAAELSTDLLVVVDDVVQVQASVAEVYEFLYSAQKWPDRLAHVVAADVRHEGDGTQLLEISTLESSGKTLHTKTARVGFPDRLIAYKQLVLPPVGASHHVNWLITETSSGSEVSSRQVVVIDEAGARAMLGNDVDLAAVRAFVTRELSGKVRLILENINEYSESDRQE
ncbi:MAG: SRPBCC family protein [Actinomycetota bacterium]|nr:SRPBCC family protein [Actinomycetota bacterium]